MLRIVLVDDDELSMNSLYTSLQINGNCVITFTSPLAALNYIEENSFEILISDFYMPEMNGVSLIKKSKQFHPNLVTILYSGNLDFPTTLNENEINYSFSKPIKLKQLLAIINSKNKEDE